MTRRNLKLLFIAVSVALALPPSVQAQDEDDLGNNISQPQISQSGFGQLEEEVIVHGIRAADINAREMERNKDIFSSVISQDDVGNFADQNVAEALQRLPGVTLQKSDGQGEFVNVRGLGPSFVGVTMNGSELATASSAGRAVGLNTISADLMGSIEVYKSLTPDMDLNSIGGKVNVNTVTAFDRGRDSLKMTLQGTMQDQRGEFMPKGSIIGTKLFADDTFGVAVSLSYEERATDINQINANTDDGLVFIRQSQPYIGIDDPGGLGRPSALSSTQYMDRYHAGSSAEADPYIDSPRMLIPNQLEVRQDDGVRTRIGGTIDLGWRPTDSSEYFLRYAHTDYTDEEVAIRENYRFINGNDFRQIAVVNPEQNFFALANTDLRHQVFIQKYNDVTRDFAFGGENEIDTWTVDYELHTSRSERETPDDRRIQFRTRALPMYGQLYQDDIRATILHQSQIIQLAEATGAEASQMGGMGGFSRGYAENVFGYSLGARRQPNMGYDNILLESGLRTDELQSAELNIRKDFPDLEFFGLGSVNYIKAGFLLKERERENLESQRSVNPSDISPSLVCLNPDGTENRDCIVLSNTSLGGARLATYTPRFDRFDHDMITLNGAEYMLDRTRRIPENLDPNRTGASSLKDNYSVYEDSAALYLMAELQVMENATLIAGARYVETEYGSTGWLTLRHDRFTDEDGILRDIALPLGDPSRGGFAVREEDGIYPGLHFRWDIRDDLLFRAAAWTSYNRPEFDKANVSAKFDGRVELCTSAPLPNEEPCGDNLTDDLGASGDLDQYARDFFTLSPGGNALELGNSELTAMQAAHFDSSISWYGDGGRFFELAVFYKEIEDFIVDVRGVDVSRTGMPLAIRQALDQIDVNVNGDAPPNRNQNVFGIAPDFVFRNVSTTINGDKATVYGLEASYAHYFDSGLGPFNGLFISGNLTLLDSKADAGETIRAEEIPLPNQADVTANFTVGWENDRFSARLISNYRSEVLREIGTCSQADINADAQWAALNDASNPSALSGATGSGAIYPENCRDWADVYHDEIFSLDFKATYSMSMWDRDIKFYLDVLNITEDVDVFYYRGNQYSGGPVLNFTEGIGRTYQAGVNISF